MKRIFALQGTNIDLDDWEFRLPSLFASLYAAQDDINASGWQTVLKIIPWRSILGIIVVFLFCFILPCGYCIVRAYTKCSKKSEQRKESIFNVSLFSNVIGTAFLGMAIYFSVAGALCSSEIKCEVMVRAGMRWALWRDISQYCQNTDGINCYYNDTANMWRQEFPTECAQCVCDHLLSNDFGVLAVKSCTNNYSKLFAAIGVGVYVVALGQIVVAVNKLGKQALVTKREVKVHSNKDYGKAIMLRDVHKRAIV